MPFPPPGDPLSMGFSRQEYWRGGAIPFCRGSLEPRHQTWSPALQADSLLSEPPGKPTMSPAHPPYYPWHPGEKTNVITDGFSQRFQEW